MLSKGKKCCHRISALGPPMAKAQYPERFNIINTNILFILIATFFTFLSESEVPAL